MFNKYLLKEFVEDYDRTIDYYVPGYREMLAKLAGEIQEDARVIIDLGCGTGNLLSLLQRDSRFELIGLDISPEMLAIAKAKLNDSITLLKQNFLNYQNNSDRFDVAIASLFWHELYDFQLPLGIEILKRILKPGGMMLAADYFYIKDNPEREREIENWFSFMCDHGINASEAAKEIEMHVRNHFELESFLTLLGKMGFSRQEVLWSKGFFKVIKIGRTNGSRKKCYQ